MTREEKEVMGKLRKIIRDQTFIVKEQDKEIEELKRTNESLRIKFTDTRNCINDINATLSAYKFKQDKKWPQKTEKKLEKS